MSVPHTSLGRSGIDVPIMGFGSAPISGLYHHVPESVAIETVQSAYNRGVTLFDSAPLYGAGWSETYVGQALAGIERDSYLLSTKIGRLLDPEHGSFIFDFSRDGVLRSLEGSMERLRTDRIDILHIHDPDKHQEQALEEAFPALDELRSQGVVRAISAGMNQWQALLNFSHFADFDCFLLAGRYTLLEQGANEFLDHCRENGVGILLGGVFNSGILATGSVPGAKHNYREAHPDILTHVEGVEAVCARHGVPLHAAAVQFALAHPGVSSLVLGAVSPGEIDANIRALSLDIPTRFWEDLHTEELIDAAAPIPGSEVQ